MGEFIQYFRSVLCTLWSTFLFRLIPDISTFKFLKFNYHSKSSLVKLRRRAETLKFGFTLKYEYSENALWELHRKHQNHPFESKEIETVWKEPCTITIPDCNFSFESVFCKGVKSTACLIIKVLGQLFLSMDNYQNACSILEMHALFFAENWGSKTIEKLQSVV